MSMLSYKELEDYKNNGYVAPINVLSLEEAEEIKKEIEHIEKKMAKRISWIRKK